jgi:pimeloyl-ACP methyl ester carboxylesterase
MKRACPTLEGIELLDGAGHWVQQEQAASVAARLIRFLRR